MLPISGDDILWRCLHTIICLLLILILVCGRYLLLSFVNVNVICIVYLCLRLSFYLLYVTLVFELSCFKISDLLLIKVLLMFLRNIKALQILLEGEKRIGISNQLRLISLHLSVMKHFEYIVYYYIIFIYLILVLCGRCLILCFALVALYLLYTYVHVCACHFICWLLFWFCNLKYFVFLYVHVLLF